MDFFKDFIYPILVPSSFILVPKLRAWFFSKVRDIQLSFTNRTNEKIDNRIYLLTKLKDPTFAIPFFGSSILIALLILIFIVFFGFTMSYKGLVFVSGPGFVVFWYLGLIYIGGRVDLAIQASNYEESVERLKLRKICNE